MKVGSDGTINNDKFHKAITQLKSVMETEHERNILDMTQVDYYKSPSKDKDATTVNDSAYTFLNSYEDDISDSNKQVEVSKKPIKDTHVHNTSVVTSSVKPEVTGVVIIGQGGRGITQGTINGGTSIISSNIITDVLTDSSMIILKSDTFPLVSFKSQMLVIASQNKPTLSCNRIVRASSEIGDSRIDHGRIGTPIMKNNIWSVDDNFSVRSDVGEANKLDTAFIDLRPMKGIRHLRDLKNKV